MEYTIRKTEELKAFGYKELGVYVKDSPEFLKLLNNRDNFSSIFLKALNDDKSIVNVFVK